ncbi:uncharacterized protein [Macrobrachium rosenbergii]|uniref:uncharacterized protein n=1 Tax=Macrobrachium rosenbergii TaxID=79674 RepID=UPI0034D4F6A9
MLFPFVFFLVSASGQSDGTLESSNEETPFTFSAKYPSITLLACWTSDRNVDIRIEFEGLQLLNDDNYNGTTRIPNFIGSNMWHFVAITMGSSRLEISPSNRAYEVNVHRNDIAFEIKSSGRIYWQRCINTSICDLPRPDSNATKWTMDSTTELTTLPLLGSCCLLVVIVVALVVYIIWLKKSAIQEPVANTNEEPIYEEIELSKNFGNSPRDKVTNETINVLYGARVPREQRC